MKIGSNVAQAASSRKQAQNIFSNSLSGTNMGGNYGDVNSSSGGNDYWSPTNQLSRMQASRESNNNTVPSGIPWTSSSTGSSGSGGGSGDSGTPTFQSLMGGNSGFLGGIAIDSGLGGQAFIRAADIAGKAASRYEWAAGGGGSKVGGGNSYDPAMARADKAGKATAYALTEEALGIQRQLDALTKLSNEIRGLGVSKDVLKSAEQNLLALAAGTSQHTANPSFQAAIDYTTEQMARRLSPYGYAPGEHSYGDTTIANTIGAMTYDWTKFWADHNRQILGLGNNLAGIGTQGAIDAARMGVEYNPYGLAASGIANVAQTSLNPNDAYTWWAQQQPKLQGLLGRA